MKELSKIILSQASVQSQVARLCGAALLAASLVGCNNYTSAPICTKANASSLNGITGTYTFSVQDSDTYNVKTNTFKIDLDQSKLKLMNGKTGKVQSSELCNVNGKFISESYNEDLKLYSQEEIFVSGHGLSFHSMMFNKKSLDSAKIPNKIFEMPENVAKIVGVEITEKVEYAVNNFLAGSGSTGLVVINGKVSPSTVVSHSATSPIGITFLRK